MDGMNVQVLVILTGLKASILFFDEEEGRSLERFGWANLPGVEILTNELVCSFLFLDREGVEFSYFWDEGFI